jgi:hypothetical protein
MVAGCQSSADEAIVDRSPVVVEAAPPASAPPNSPAVEPTAASPLEPMSPTAALASAEFVPPFPDRLELFEPPKRAQSTVRRDDESGNTVELKGFINVNGPRAVLSIDGVIAPIAEGGEKYGVQVISIDVPTVVLQRGRSRWTASLD